MKTGKNRVKGLKSQLFKKYQTDPVVLNPSSQNNVPSWGTPEVTPLITNIEDIYKDYDPYNTQYAVNKSKEKLVNTKYTSMLDKIKQKDQENFASQSDVYGPMFPYQYPKADVSGGTEPVTKLDEKNLTIGQTTSSSITSDSSKPKESYTWRDYSRMGLGMINTALSLKEDIKNREATIKKINDQNDQGRHDNNYFQFAARPGSQKIIYAEEGAEIRTGTDTGAEEAELERGEYFILPDGDEYSVGGKKHSQGGEKFVLPEGTIVFSDYLKIPGTNTTFAKEAKKYPLEKYSEVIQNQHAKSVDRNTAQILYDRNSKKLMQLFQMQQAMNGNSNGEVKDEVQAKRGMLYGQVGLYNDVTTGLGISDALPNWARLSNQMQTSMAQNAQQINAERYRNQQLSQTNSAPTAFSLDERGRPYVQTMLANPEMQYPYPEFAPRGYNNTLDMIDITPEELASSMSNVFDKLGVTDSERRTQFIAQMVGKANQGYLFGASSLANRELNAKYPNAPKTRSDVVESVVKLSESDKDKLILEQAYKINPYDQRNYAANVALYASVRDAAKNDFETAKKKFEKNQITKEELQSEENRYNEWENDLKAKQNDLYNSMSGPFGGTPLGPRYGQLSSTLYDVSTQPLLTTNTGNTSPVLTAESFIPGLDPKAIQTTVNNLMQGLQFDNEEQANKAREELTNELKIKAAAKIDAYGKTTTGADKSLQQPVNTSTNNVKKQADPADGGTVTDGNAVDINSRHWTKIAGTGGVERKVWKEGQGQWAGKKLSEQYGDNPILLLRNRINENYDVLSSRLVDAYRGQLKNKNLATGKVEDMLDVLDGGNNSLIKFRQFFTEIGRDTELFDPMLDRAGKGGENKNQEKTLALFKEYIESNTFREDVEGKDGKGGNPALLNMPLIKGKIVKGANGNYTLEEGATFDKDFTEKYQAAYRAIAAVKKQQPKDKDLLKGFRVSPEGLSDQTFLGLPISPTDRWEGNTYIGQIVGFEDEEFRKKKEEPPSPDVVTTSPGGPVPGKVGPAPQGNYEKAIFDIAQLAPEFYGLANSEIFPYVPFDYNAPYVMPQTLNIQPQLQDIDNSYVAALRAGADPNAAFMSSLSAKQRIYSEKQNFDAQQRAAADQQNAKYRWQEDIQDINSLDRVYNTLMASADDARTSQIQDIVRSATQKRNVWNFEENRKKLYFDNFVRNYNWDGNTGQATLSNPQGYDPFNLAMTAEMLNAAYGTKPATKTIITTSKTATEPSKTTTTTTTSTVEEEKKKKEAKK